MNNTNQNTKDFYQFFFIQNDIPLSLGNYLDTDNVSILHTNKNPIGDNGDNTVFIEKQDNIDPEKYGRCLGLYWIWKNIKSEYIGFSFDGKIFADQSNLNTVLSENNPQIVYLERKSESQSLREMYKDEHYDYDLKVLRECIKRLDFPLYDLSEKILRENKRIYPTVIMRKDTFRKLCAWLFMILEECDKEIKEKRSTIQNRCLEYLADCLINIYIENNCSKMSSYEINEYVEAKIIDSVDENYKPEGEMLDYIQTLVNEGDVEKAIEYVNSHKDENMYEDLKRVFGNYERQRRFYSQTDLDKNADLVSLIAYSKNPEKKSRSNTKVLIIEWDSINKKDFIENFNKLGFEVATLFIGEKERKRDTYKNMDRTIEFLSEHHFDVVFSINYFDYISEACYINGIHYLAWTYDSPANLGNLKYAEYDTTHIFLFDSYEVDNYKKAGYKNIHYLPLAVDVNRLDNMIYTKDDLEKYEAQISFVGQLYATHLTEYLNYLSDYKKGFFNAMLDYNTGLYDSHVIEDIFSRDLTQWLDEKAFREEVYKNEKKSESIGPIADDSIESIVKRISLLTSNTITNRERLILLSLLSNHWQLKLYSTSSHDVLKNVIECGTVDYYTEMPKVFRCSKINLNITFKKIKTGMPLRCLDIMGSHGFLLTNYQRDLNDHFVDGENIAVFHTLDEAFEKCKYYLEHEDARQKVADEGYNTVRKYYSYEYLLRKLFEEASLGYLFE